jgi:hypothetical protein
MIIRFRRAKYFGNVLLALSVKRKYISIKIIEYDPFIFLNGLKKIKKTAPEA